MGFLSKIFKVKSRDPTGPENMPEGDGGYADYLSYLIGDPVNTESKYMAQNLYTMILARTCIDKIATECSKAVPILSKPNARIEYFVSRYPNPVQDISQFIYQLVTILFTDNNVYIVPIYNEFGQIDGMWVCGQDRTTVYEVDNTLWLKYQLDDGKEYVCKYSDCAHLKRHQYRKTLSGESNFAFSKLAATYEENLDRSIAMLRNGALPIQWVGKLNTSARDDMIRKEQEEFAKRSLEGNRSGILIYDAKFEDLKQINRDQKTMIPGDLKILKEQAYAYWGVSEAILTNKYTEDDWNGFYQSRIEPVLIQIKNALTRMIFTKKQIIYQGQSVEMQSDRLQYASIKSRQEVAFGLFDRSMATKDESRRVLNLPPMADGTGDEYAIRGEYRTGGNVMQGKDGDKSETENVGKNNDAQSGSERQPDETS